MPPLYLAVQIVSDLKTLRTLAEYLLILDPVTFLGYLENLRAAESINSIWLFHDAAHTIFEQVKIPHSDSGLQSAVSHAPPVAADVLSSFRHLLSVQ